MVSIGKPPPADPPCAWDELIPPLDSDERASPSRQLPDLTHDPSVSNFSIRNYVFHARNKDISTNWPFSMRNLQLCLKHGVKDPLPPFQFDDNATNQTFLRSPVKSSSSLEKEISGSNSTPVPLRLSKEDNTRSHNGISSDKDSPLMVGDVSQLVSELITTHGQLNSNSVSVNPVVLPDTSHAKEAAGPTVACKTATAIQPAGKKGRLPVKLGKNLERSSTECIASNGAAISEIMASKVCPVCKVFSSSSNTTLNAHIDQCLSEEPTPKWSAGSKLIRRRMKPRKTRLMVDIYETALPCTLEDLDRRNGSNWSTGMSLPSKDDVDEMGQRVSPVNHDDDVGAVYIDSNGTKLRILSRSSDSPPSSSTIGVSLRPRKRFKGNKNKFLLFKKKRRKKKAHKRHEYMEHASHSKEFHHQKARKHGSQDPRGQKKCNGLRGDGMDEPLLVPRSQGPLQPGISRTLEERTGSKMPVTLKKVMDKDKHPFRCTLHAARDMLMEGGRSYSANNVFSNEHDSDSSESPSNGERMRVPVIEGGSPRKMKLGNRLFHGPASSNREGSNLLTTRKRCNQFSDPFRFKEDGANFHGRDKLSVPSAGCGKSPMTAMASRTQAVRFSRGEKHVPSVCPMRTSKSDGAKGSSTTEQSKMCLVEQVKERGQGKDLDPSGTSPSGSFMGSFGQGTANLRHCDNAEGRNVELVSLSNKQLGKLSGIDFSMNESEDHCDDDMGGFNLQSKLGSDDNTLNFRKYLNLDTPIENRGLHDRSSTETYNGGLSHIDDPFPGIIDKDTVYGTNEQESDLKMDTDTHVREDYEVERILIPGPPGSFLPSPRALILEEFQGNSSLTTGQVLPSHELQDAANRDSSDSPVSATSTISDSVPVWPERKCVGTPMFVGHHEAHQEKASLDSSDSGSGFEPFALNSSFSLQPSTIGVSSERSIGKSMLFLKNDDQPCCCQRKERGSQGSAQSCLQSQLLKRRKLGSLTAIDLGKCPNQSPESIHEEGRSEVLLPRNAPLDAESAWERLSSVVVNPKGSTETGPKVSDGGNSVSTTSICNPVLRLMGKNLMVINQEDASTPLGHSQPAGAWSKEPASSHVPAQTSISCGSIPTSSSGNQPALANKLPSMSVNWHSWGYANRTFSFPNQPPRSNVEVSNSRDSRPMKEIIVIDDTPEDEITAVAVNTIRQGGFSRERQTSIAPVAPFPMKTTAAYEPRLVGSFPLNYSRNTSFAHGPSSSHSGSGAVGVQWHPSLVGTGAFLQSRRLSSGPPTDTHIRTPMPSSSGLPQQIYQ
ncbi:hypothetical protein SAY86_004268 [Trapa natans]|uniref:Hapless 8 n=1 Tax=Trapa natans TaxID=22666 RepID=A0AAN7RNL8_TRANT|nr:hypothetical protein SAY86_004268 [Trapa natans]